VTKTVDGMCADCWGVKDPARAKRWLRASKSPPRFDPVRLLWAGATLVALVLVVLVLASEWI
jgi:hypothetical protein